MDRVAVLIVDDHEVVRQGLRSYLELQEGIQVVGEAANGEEAFAKAEQLRPDVVLMDLVMPQMDGIEATRRLLRAHPQAKIIVLSSFTDDERVFPAIEAGAISYLLKDVKPAQLAEAILAAHRGEPKLDAEITRKIMAQVAGRRDKAAPEADALTERELEVLRLVAQGLSNQAISERLVISEATVRTHMTNILGKLQLASRTQAALFALRHGIASLEDPDSTP